MNPTKALWQERVLSKLPPEDNIRARNAAINASYASWYLRHPDWYRWAGMAAFASYRVGLLLAVFDFSRTDQNDQEISDTPASLLDDGRLIASLEMLRRANNNAFANVGWAHAAYESSDGGIDAIEAGLSDDPTQIHLLTGFRMVEQARQLLRDHPDQAHAADALFWKAGLTMLQHEQWGVIQDHFAQLDIRLGLSLTLITSLDFDANHLARDTRTYCGFLRHMWTFGIPVQLMTLSLPDITLLAHRWSWVRWTVFTTWKRVAHSDSALPRKLAHIVRVARPFDTAVYDPWVSMRIGAAVGM